MPEQNDDTFRVVDRRLFNSEGELRQDAADQIERERESEVAKPASPAPGAESKEAAQEKPPAEGPAPEAPRRSPAFEMVIDLIARNAVAMLGGMADPRTGQPMFDLEGAREVIDMLDALHEKTRGNLAPEEERLLIEVIGSLKMTYLEMSKAAAAATAEVNDRARGKR
ncbi:MAG TPA: DUF1844 domain-containing protein [Candidatus Dormibacteraeota bacterium]|nr:DUF1844 domain-containing protein [Candidatus Dormibacteraeota bacterium]